MLKTVGIFGHVDHGKTSLVKAISNINTDNLKEEQERGLSIRVGFAYLKLPSGLEVSIQDCPGHEKFIANTIQGAFDVGVAILAIASNEGIKKQTIEHLEILSRLDIENVLVVITKSDLEASNEIDKLRQQLSYYLKNNFKNLKIGKILAVSTKTRANVDQLLLSLSEIFSNYSKPCDYPLMIIDRLYNIQGQGLVVVGVMRSRPFARSTEIELMPQKQKVQIRNIQSHQKEITATTFNQRVAINISNLGKYLPTAGDWLCPKDSLAIINEVIVHLDSNRTLKRSFTTTLHINKKQYLAMLKLIKQEKHNLEYWILKTNTPLLCFWQDKFLLRNESGVFESGQIVSLDTSIFDILKLGKESSLENYIETVLTKRIAFKNRSELVKNLGLQQITNRVEKCLFSLAEQGKLKITSQGIICNVIRYEKIKEEIVIKLRNFHKLNSQLNGIKLNELRQSIGVITEVFKEIINELSRESILEINGDIVCIHGFKPYLASEKDEVSIHNVLTKIEKNEGVSEVSSLKKEHLQYLIGTNRLHLLSDLIVVTNATLVKWLNLLIVLSDTEVSITVQIIKQRLGVSRKYLIPFLEFCDRKKFTCRTGNIRLVNSKNSIVEFLKSLK